MVREYRKLLLVTMGSNGGSPVAGCSMLDIVETEQPMNFSKKNVKISSGKILDLGPMCGEPNRRATPKVFVTVGGKGLSNKASNLFVR